MDERKGDIIEEQTVDRMEGYKEERIDPAAFSEKVMQLRGKINGVVVGQQEAVALLLTAALADGHVLIGGMPGVAKTLLTHLLSRLIDVCFSRIQFTPGLTPSDVLGMTIFNMKTFEFDFHEGPVFPGLTLIDEVNYAPAKTQAALFEVMEECQMTIDGIARRVSDVYIIITTQNPVEQEGTYRLPEAQLDRLLFKMSVGYPSVDEEMNILKCHQERRNLIKLEDVEPIFTIDELLQMHKKLDTVFTKESLLRYITDIVQQTRISKAVYLGASPHTSVAILNAAKASTPLGGRDSVTPENIKFVTLGVLQYRPILTAETEMEECTPLKVTQKLIDKVEVPK